MSNHVARQIRTGKPLPTGHCEIDRATKAASFGVERGISGDADRGRPWQAQARARHCNCRRCFLAATGAIGVMLQAAAISKCPSASPAQSTTSNVPTTN